MGKKKTTEEFIKEARLVHGDRYDYSKVEYINNHTKVCIICPIHGEFWQNPKSHIRGNGCQKCAIDKSRTGCFSIGINDDSEYNARNKKSYKKWQLMIQRCYYERDLKRNPTYIECYVCDDWLLFSNFEKWFNENYVEGWELDKDILVKDNKVYSPDTCCFIPHEINSCFTQNKHKGNKNLGVTKMNRRGKTRYVARMHTKVGSVYLGEKETQEEAFLLYKNAKEKHAKYLANKYKDKLSNKVYNVLMNFNI